MAKWITLVRITPAASPSAVLRFAAQDTPGPDGPYLGLLAGFNDFERGVPKLPGLPIISQFEVSFKNHEGHFSQYLAQYELRGGTFEMLIGLDGAAESSFSTQFTGKVVDLARPLTPGFCNFVVKDSSADRWKQDIPNDIPASDFPNLPEHSPEAVANIIFGHVTSVGKGDQGAVNCPLVDTVDRLYLLARHRCFEVADWLTVYVLGGDGTETYDIEEYDAPSGRTYTLIKAHEDWEDPERTGTEFTVAADCKGLFDEAGDGHLITNPAEAVRLFNTMFCGYDESGDFEEVSYGDAFDDYALAEYSVDGCIDAPGPCEAIIAAFQRCFNLELYFDEEGLMAFHLLTVETADPADPSFDDVEDIQIGTFQIHANDEVVNALAIHYDRDPSSGKWLKEPPVVNNILSQASLGLILREELELPLVSTAIDQASPSAPSSGDLTALEVASVRLYYSDEGRWVTVFQLSAPAVPATFQLTGRIKVTHPFGLSATGDGWTDKLFRVITIRYLDLVKTPKIEVTAMQLEPGPTAYMLNDEPINGVWDSTSETADGQIIGNWSLAPSSPSSGPDPAWFHVWYKRVEDELTSRFLHFAGRIAAAVGTIQFEAIYDEAGDLDLYLRPEDSSGVLRRDMDTVATIVHTPRTKIAAPTLAAVTTGLSVGLSWDALTDPNEISMFSRTEVWRSPSLSIPEWALIDSVTVDAYTDINYAGDHQQDANMLYYRIRRITKYGVPSDYSNVIGPLNMRLEVGSISVVTQGDTFILDIGLPANVTIDEVEYFELAYDPAIWVDPTHLADTAEHSYIIGPTPHQEGADAEKTYYFAVRARYKNPFDGGTDGFTGAWSYLMDDASPSAYGAVTSGTSAKLQADNATNYIGNAADPDNRIGYNQVTQVLEIPASAVGGATGFDGYTPITADGVASDFALTNIADLTKEALVFEDSLKGRRDRNYYLQNDSPITGTRIYFTDDDGTTPRVPQAGILIDVHFVRAL